MPLSDHDFAAVLDQLYRMSRDCPVDGEDFSEGLIRAAVVLLVLQSGEGPEREALAHRLVDAAFDWCAANRGHLVQVRTALPDPDPAEPPAGW